MSGRQYSLSHEADIAALYKRVHTLETAGPYDSQISTINGNVSSLGAVQSYNPVWSGTGTPPAIGNGTLKGKYIKVGKLVIAWISQVHGSSTTYGTGSAYNWTLPTTAANTNSVPEMPGSWIGTPTASSVFTGVTDVTQGSNTGNCWLQITAAALNTYGASTALGTLTPSGWANGGSIRATFMYESTT